MRYQFARLVTILLLISFGIQSRQVLGSEQSDILSDQIHAYLETLVDHGFSGAVLVAIDGQIVVSEGYGLADDAGQTNNTAETVFDTGSLSKQFSAAAIMHLIETGNLRIDDTLADIFEAVPTDKAKITIHQLLTHSSGLPDFVYEGAYRLERDAAVQRAFDAPLELEPGERYLYSDTGYGLLAAIVEIVSGQSFQVYLHEYLFQPAGMQHTGFYNEAHWETLPVAHAYFNATDRGSVDSLPGPYWDILGFGGVMTTVNDLYRWHLALQNTTVLSSESVEMLFTPHIDENINGISYYGYGWVIMDHPELGNVIWHDGADFAHNAIFLNLIDYDTQVIVLSNRIDGDRQHETFYGIETGFALTVALINDDFSILPSFAA